MTKATKKTRSKRKTPIFSKRLKGLDLLALSDKLNSPTRLETSYILGVPPVTWYKYGRKTGKEPGAAEPISRPSLCLLVRFAFTFPERLQRTIYPEPGPLFEKLRQIEPKATYKYFSELLGRESSAGHRWLKKGNSFDGTTRRLALHLNQYLSEGRLDEWEELVNFERELRGVTEKRSLALDNPDQPLDPEFVQTTSPAERMLVVGDVSYLQGLYELTSVDSMYHLGLSQRLWSELRNANPLLPIRDPVLSILLRLYLNYPEDLDGVRLPTVTIDDVFKAVNDPKNGIEGQYQPDEIALMLGFSPSIAQRWRYTGNYARSYTPLHYRLMSHFYQELVAGRFNDWYRLVMVEAESRGIEDLWDTGWEDDS